jgi:hypothetical protein
MRKLILIAGAAARNQSRWAREHIYHLLFLTPLVFGITYVTAARLVSNNELWRPSATASIGLAALVEIALAGASLSRVTAEIYHVRRAETFLDHMPLSVAAHFDVALVLRLARTLLAGLLVLGARSILAAGPVVEPSILPPLLVFIALTAAVEIFAALHWIHWGHTRSGLTALGGLVVALIGAIAGGLLMALIIRPDVVPWSHAGLIFGGGVWAAILLLLGRWCHERWRASDLEYAKRLQFKGRWGRLAARAARRFDPVVAAQLGRDLRLTLRAFSSAVYVAIGIACLWLAVLFMALTTDLLPAAASAPNGLAATWLPPIIATKVVTVLATASLAALAPVLVAHQLPHYWLERATGVSGSSLWRTKLWYTRMASCWAPVASWAVGFAGGATPLFYAAPLLIECVWLWWLVSSLVGWLSFEIPDRPELAIVVTLTVAISLGLFTTALWPVGIGAYGFMQRPFTERGGARAHRWLQTEGD